MDLTIDTAKLSPMVGRLDVYRALLEAMNERHPANENVKVLKQRLMRRLQYGDLTVRLSNSQARVPAEIAFIGRTVAEVHPRPNVVRSSQP